MISMIPTEWWIEDKYDGFRSQVHADDGRVASSLAVWRM